jgi:hypothetical protein
LAEALRSNVRGLYCAEAAVELLIGHLGWLLRGDFVGQFVETGEGLVDGTPMAWVDWPAAVAALEAGRLPCSCGEGQVLRIAASIADGVLIDLSQAVSGLDDANIVLAARAILHAAGRREAGVMVVEAGR